MIKVPVNTQSFCVDLLAKVPSSEPAIFSWHELCHQCHIYTGIGQLKSTCPGQRLHTMDPSARLERYPLVNILLHPSRSLSIMEIERSIEATKDCGIITRSSSTNASSPYNPSLAADVVLRTSDDVDFYVIGPLLRFVSLVFMDMYSDVLGSAWSRKPA